MSNNHFLEFLELVKPSVKFNKFNSPEKPNYEKMNSWAAHPDRDGPQFLVPNKNFKSNKKNNLVDVFYIHPTGFFEKKWNFDLNLNTSTFERTEIMLGNQVSAFNESCNIFAPSYRQATYYSFFDKNSNSGTKALDLAYQDIENAFIYFINNFNNNKPFIIFGHSQGALLGQRLIHKMIDETNLIKRFICAYLIGYMIPEKYFKDLFRNITYSKKFNDLQSIVSWSTVVEGFKRNRERTPFWTPNGWSSQLMSQKIVSINPFSWTLDSKWHSEDSNTSIINKAQNYDFLDRFRSHHTGIKKSIGLTSEQEFVTSLNKKSGLLESKGRLINNFKKMKYFNGDLHSFDVMLFWGSLRKNAQHRIDSFFKSIKK